MAAPLHEAACSSESGSREAREYLSDDELQKMVRAHFHDEDVYAKEVAETLSAFRYLASDEPTELLSLACGSCVGAELFRVSFPNPKSTLHGVDIEKRQTVSFLLEQERLSSFLECDLFAEPVPEAAKHLFQSCNAWIAIHACRLLANRCVQLFRRFSPAGARLVVMPCCLLKTSVMKDSIGIQRWKEIRAIHQQRESSECKGRMGNADWRTDTAIQVRNELLAREFPEGFVEEVEFDQVPSRHNRALVFRNCTAAPV